MEFIPSARLLPLPKARDENELWYSSDASSPRKEQAEQTHMARLRCQQELQKLYEDTPENAYDLSLKDLVDPWITISGNLKAIVAEEELSSQAQAKTKGRKSPPIPKLHFSFSFPGLSAKAKRPDSKAVSASNQCLRGNLATSRVSKSSSEASASFSSKIHPSNQCSSCSSFTIFFKTRCSVCGRLYCSMCAKEYMDTFRSGFKCKGPCKSSSFRKRLASKCWPTWSSFFDAPRLKHKTMKSNYKQEIML